MDKKVMNGTNSIDYDVMKVRLDFAYRLMCQVTKRVEAVPAKSLTFTEEQFSEFLSFLVTQAGALIFQRRFQNGFRISDSELTNMRGVANIIVEHFNSLRNKIAVETSGMPIGLSLSTEEYLIEKGIDELLSLLKNIISYGK